MDNIKNKGDLLKLIANSIKKADKTYFFEDYYAQANEVLKRLSEEGLVVLPKEPNEYMLQEAEKNILYGKNPPKQVIRKIYLSMINNFF